MVRRSNHDDQLRIMVRQHITLQTALYDITSRTALPRTQYVMITPAHLDMLQSLEPRHWRVLVGKLLYYSHDEIAALLGVSTKTVSNYVGQICDRLDCVSIEQACRIVQVALARDDHEGV